MRSLGRFISVGGSWSVALALVSVQALAQPSKDNASPPIDVPTTPVPQGMQPPPPPPPAAPKPQPKPAPAPGAPKAAPPADKPKEQPGTDDGEKKAPSYNNEGVFKISGTKGSGVVGGSSKKPAAGAAAPTGGGGAKAGGGKAGGGKAKPAAAASTANVAQWPGFHLTEDGGSEVIVEFSKATNAPTEHKAAGSYTYVFKGPVIAKANNKNPLLTLHFNTPVASARLVPGKGEVRLVIEMRAGVDAAGTSGMRAPSEGGTGQQFFVKFPAGSFLPKNADSEEMPPPPSQKLKDKGKKGSESDKADKAEEPEKKPEPKTKGGSKTGPSAE